MIELIMQKKTFITTPIYYANGNPHIGHAATTVVADVLARSLKLQGVEVFFSTGLDEHGQKNQKVIEERKITAKVYHDEIRKKFVDLFKVLNIEYDDFIQTTEKRHIDVVQGVLAKLHKEGKFFKKEDGGLYCEGCELFLEDDQLDAEGMCKDHKRKPTLIKEENYYFNLSKHADWLTKLLNKEGFFTETYKKELLNMIKEGLPDLCISRPKSRVWHGIELPFDTDYVTYVWFDALLNYLTVLGYPNDFTKPKQEFWDTVIHFMAKEIIKPHGIFWPIMLREMGVNPPHKEFVHGFITAVDGSKMSKSLGTGLDPSVAIEQVGAEGLRWVLTKGIQANDVGMDYQSIVNTFNTDLANIIGNAFFRIYSMAKKSFKDSKVPKAAFDARQKKFIDLIKKDVAEILPTGKDINETSQYARSLLDVFRNINVYIDHTAPWKIENVDKKNQELLAILEALKIAFSYAAPVIPEAAAKVKDAIGKCGTVLKDVEPLFIRIK
ncbi:MAG: methionine--tRNA ligase [Firmicutes bacterium]|nr:methionine--tRNA ligase [Bacillota bacterium]